MTETKPGRAHLIAGGFPPGSSAGHDQDYARIRLLGLLAEREIPASVSNDFTDVEKWLPVSRLLITYVAGPYPDAAQCGAIVPAWMAAQFEGLDDDPETRRLVATSIAAEQCRLLQANGVHEFHFYTLNRADLTVAICHMIGVRGRPPAEARKAAT